ncbi:hypothetical protein [Streptosporangium sp. NPDC006930]|uniref:DODA-type extradiol aromatic ring-opening family dioxygenase n=1 Tax=unclassified Streptosporangium TaxID=2632669 RepID=UPI00341F0CCE
MAELLGIGITHYPRLAGPDDQMTATLRRTLSDPGIPAQLKDPASWPEDMRAEWGDDQGTTAAAAHREQLRESFARVRAAIDNFRPDVVVIWGDDQYEQFREDIVPPFCLYALDRFGFQPWREAKYANAWDEPADLTLSYPGARDIGRRLAGELLSRGFDLPYAYKLREDRPVPHAFGNSLLYLDSDRTGFPYPVLPISVNCYGSAVISRKGGVVQMSELGDVVADPPGPTPQRCMELGAAVAEVLAGSDLRAVLLASSSWSHAFLNDRSMHLWPDMESDREYLAALRASDFDTWRGASTGDLELSGQQEMLNWHCMLGAAERAGLKTEWAHMVESWIFNSSKTFAILR